MPHLPSSIHLNDYFEAILLYQCLLKYHPERPGREFLYISLSEGISMGHFDEFTIPDQFQ